MSTRSTHIAFLASSVAGVLLLASCASRAPYDWGDFDVLADPPPPAPQQLAGIDVEAADYQHFLHVGERMFREGGFGSERTIGDVLGPLAGTVEVPCQAQPLPPPADPADGDAPAEGADAPTEAAPAPDADCREERLVLEYYLDAVDGLDGVQGNLFVGNDGDDGPGYTSDLVLEFPAGTTLYGLPVPERLHMGLDVEKGAAWPIGLEPVPTDDDGAWLIEPAALGHGPAPEGKLRLRLGCAACHYSLDVDNDGVADLHSTRPDQPTPGSPYRPDHGWGVGNHDLHFGWLFATAANPLMGSMVLGGKLGTPKGPREAEAAVDFFTWVRNHFVTDEEMVTREIVRGFITQPRFYADVSPDGLFNTIQLPPLYSRRFWPSNSNGALFDGTDRNNTVWTGALDFTSLIGLAEGSPLVPLIFNQPTPPFDLFTKERYAELVLRKAPAIVADPGLKQAYTEDLLGTSDGIPGLLDADSLVVMGGPVFDKELLKHADNQARLREPADFGEAAAKRGPTMAALGYRVAFPPDDPRVADVDAWVAKYDGLVKDDYVVQTVETWLTWLEPPPNNTALLRNARGLVADGYRIFQDEGCADCHSGPYFSDNEIKILSSDPAKVFGRPRTPSTAGWRVPDRDVGPPIDTQPDRALNASNVRRLLSADYSAATGEALGAGGLTRSIFRVQQIGYKTPTLRHMWASAPYLHDGGVAVALARGVEPGDDLAALLSRSDALLYGMGAILADYESDPSGGPRANAALSLQALVLKQERDKVIAANRTASFPTPPLPHFEDEPTHIPMQQLGIEGVGHDYYIDDSPGGERVTALVAFLLALDDCPGDLPGGPQGSCPAPTYPGAP